MVEALCQRKDEEVNEVREDEVHAHQTILDLEKELIDVNKGKEKAEWDKKEQNGKCEAVFTKFTQVMNEKERIERETMALVKEEEEWKSFKERQERAIVNKSRENQKLKIQMSRLLSNEHQRVQALQQVHDLKASEEHQKIGLEG